MTAESKGFQSSFFYYGETVVSIVRIFIFDGKLLILKVGK